MRNHSPIVSPTMIDEGLVLALGTVGKIDASATTMKEVGVPARIMVDCSHGNSQKKHENQLIAATSVAEQIASGSNDIMGVMIESNINEGNQKMEVGKPLRYGVSVTDACIHWADTVKTLRALAKSVQRRRAKTSCMKSEP